MTDGMTAIQRAGKCWYDNAGELGIPGRVIPAIESAILAAETAAWNAAVAEAEKAASMSLSVAGAIGRIRDLARPVQP